MYSCLVIKRSKFVKNFTVAVQSTCLDDTLKRQCAVKALCI